nr:hypothetical protein [Tanacetum cinerariifolium]
MVLSSPSITITSTTNHHFTKLSHHQSSLTAITFSTKPATTNHHQISLIYIPKWRTIVSFFNKTKDATFSKQEFLDVIENLDFGAEATIDDQGVIEQIVQKLKAANPTKEPLKSPLIDRKWELISTSESVLQTK